jgi:hypothetical protein
MRLRSGLLSIALGSAALVSQRAEASPIIFTDRAAFEAAAEPNILVTFDDIQPDRWAPAFCFQPASSCSYFVDSVAHVSSFSFTDNHSGVGGGALSLNFQAITGIGVDGPPMIAIGFDVLPGDAVPGQFVGLSWVVGVDPMGGPIREGVRLPADAPGFFGLFADPIGGFELTTNTTGPGLPRSAILDNVAITSVPEPSTALLVLAGAMVLSQRRRFTRPK